MNQSLARILSAISMSFVIASGFTLLHFTLNSNHQNAFAVSFGLSFITLIFSLITIDIIRKIFQTEKEDYNQNQIDLMIDSLELTMQKKRGILPGDTISYDDINTFGDIEFNYTVNPEKLPQADIDQLQ